MYFVTENSTPDDTPLVGQPELFRASIISQHGHEKQNTRGEELNEGEKQSRSGVKAEGIETPDHVPNAYNALINLNRLDGSTLKHCTNFQLLKQICCFRLLCSVLYRKAATNTVAPSSKMKLSIQLRLPMVDPIILVFHMVDTVGLIRPTSIAVTVVCDTLLTRILLHSTTIRTDLITSAVVLDLLLCAATVAVAFVSTLRAI